MGPSYSHRPIGDYHRHQWADNHRAAPRSHAFETFPPSPPLPLAPSLVSQSPETVNIIEEQTEIGHRIELCPKYAPHFFSASPNISQYFATGERDDCEIVRKTRGGKAEYLRYGSSSRLIRPQC